MPSFATLPTTKPQRSAVQLKEIATRAGVQLGGGNELTAQEDPAFTALTTNTDMRIPKEIQGQIISLVDNSAVLFGDVSRSTFKHQFELVRHTGIAQGDAEQTEEGKAPTDGEKNEFDTIGADAARGDQEDR